MSQNKDGITGNISFELTSGTSLGVGALDENHPILQLMRRDQAELPCVIVLTDGETLLSPDERAALMGDLNRSLAVSLHGKSEQLLHIDASIFAHEASRRLLPDPFFMPSGSMRGESERWPHSLYGHPEGYRGFGDSSRLFQLLELGKRGHDFDIVADPDLPAAGAGLVENN